MAGGRNSGKKKSKDQKDESPFLVVRAFIGFACVVLLAAVVGAWIQRRAAARQEAAVKNLELMGTKLELQNKLKTMMEEMQKVEDKRSKAEQEKAEAEGAGLGQGIMQAQAKMIGKLLELTQQVDALKGEDQREERLAVSKRVEEELVELEVAAQEHAGTALGKQQAGLIALVREALRSDREGKDVNEDEWNDELLRVKHGLVTYATPAYWDDAYGAQRYGDTFEWYGGWVDNDLKGKSLGSVMKPLLNSNGKTLMLGCGNSNMSKLMQGDGFRDITSVDISEKVIEQMRARHGEADGFKWQVADASNLEFTDSTFDSIIEKGMFDALFAGTGERVQAVLSEAVRVMRPGSKLISVSFGDDRITRLFKKEGTSHPLECQLADQMLYGKGGEEESKNIYVYACQRI